MKKEYIGAYEKFLKAWGYDAQSLMCIEEMSELTKALCKYKRYGKESCPKEIKDNILEEIADVLNTVEQMEYVFGEKKIEEIRKQKIEKTLNRLAGLNQKQQKEKVIVVATKQEYDLVKDLTKLRIIKTEPGSSNIIRALKDLKKDTLIINIGFAGSNILPVGSIVKVRNSYLYHPNIEFDETHYCLGGEVDCYTSNDFVLVSNKKEPVVFDMELNTICAMGFEVESYKIVSDNLSIKEYESVDLKEKWQEVINKIGE